MVTSNTSNTILKYTTKLSKRSKGGVVIIDTKQAIMSILKLGGLTSREVQILLRRGRFECHDKSYHIIEVYKPMEEKRERNHESLAY